MEDLIKEFKKGGTKRSKTASLGVGHQKNERISDVLREERKKTTSIKTLYQNDNVQVVKGVSNVRINVL